ncbi:MAG: dihydrolipoyllysine-residue acetyltransferase [Cellvibrio sp.]|nr:dihydrolipoyllysine-residue acetyltransferase [Cellvibrio sp.]
MAIQTIKVPDLGGAEGVEVIEISVKVGDSIAEGDSIVVLETDKASMEIPADASGKVTALKIKIGDKVSQGDALIDLEVSGATASAPTPEAAPAPVAAPAPAAAPSASAEVKLIVPDLGGAEGVEVIEVAVKVGDQINSGDSIVVLETDKASMEIPAEVSGTILSLSVKVGDKVSQGFVLGVVSAAGAAPAVAATQTAAPAQAAAVATAPVAAATSVAASDDDDEEDDGSDVYAGPAVRKLARQLGVDLDKVKATGPRGRVQKDDLHNYVKPIVQAVQSGNGAVGSGIPALPVIDYAKFGEIEIVKMSKIKKLTADAMTRSWLNVPRITQFDDADITDLEAFRNSMKAEAEKRGSKLTPLPFIVKAVAAALVAEPSFNVSMHQDGESIVQKKFVHIGIAVDTPNGLLVPVVRNADKKGLFELADEINALAKKARDGKLTPAEMQGGCFTISSLGAMGGNGFTPMVSAPTEVGILGVSRAQMKPVWNGKEFIPRNMLPLSLSYDHRAVNGSDAGRFMTYLVGVIGDLRRLLL